MAEENNNRAGLGKEPKKNWPKLSKKDLLSKPIDRLVPESDAHKRVLEYLIDRIKHSEHAMGKFYDRWQVNEKKYQAYIDLSDWEKILKDLNNTGEAPKVVSITVPYSFATINTIVTYLLHTFAGQKPMFQVGTTKGEAAKNAQMMEHVLQYNADHTRLIKHLYQFFLDMQIYGVGIMRNKWKETRKIRTVWVQQPKQFFGMQTKHMESIKKRENRLVYAGNEIDTIDPFMFLPDPRVPMNRCNRDGEFLFWRTFEGKHQLKIMASKGELRWVDNVGDISSAHSYVKDGDSARSVRSEGDPHPGREVSQMGWVKNFVECVQGTIWIIPNEIGLGKNTPEDDLPQLWIFTLGNRKQILQAEPFGADHEMHPVAIAEPYGMGYGFGQCGMADYLGPMQDLMSWFINSHIDNVRAALNNMWLVDPSKVELQDLKKPGAGKIIRLKKSAYGQDVRQAIQQLAVLDVTTNHVKDFQLLMNMTDSMSSITDNLRGIQDSGGRKTATEVRTAGEAAASRLAAQSRIISAQAMVDLTEMMTLNLQQNLTDEFYLEIVGQKGAETPIKIGPEHLVGDFHYPLHDGTLPLDRVALLDIWREIFQGVAADPTLRQSFNIIEMFKYLAELGGARNIDQFIINAMPDEQMLAMVEAGNAVGGGQLPPSPAAPVTPNAGIPLT